MGGKIKVVGQKKRQLSQKPKKWGIKKKKGGESGGTEKVPTFSKTKKVGN